MVKGQHVGYIKDGRNHLHFETLAGFQNSTGDNTNTAGYYGQQQHITNWNTVVATAAMSRLTSARAGLPVGLSTQSFNGVDSNGNLGQWTPSGLWHVSSRQKDDYAFRYGIEGKLTYSLTTSGSPRATGGVLMSPDFVTPSAPTVKFKTWFRTEKVANPVTSDSRLSGSVDRKQIYAQRIGTDDVLLIGDIMEYDSTLIAGNQGGWVDKSFAIPPSLVGQAIRVWFVFNTADEINNNFAGWYVDDVTVQADVNINTLSAVTTPTVTAFDYTVSVNQTNSASVDIAGTVYGSGFNLAALELWFFGPGCEGRSNIGATGNICLVPIMSIDQNASSSSKVKFVASLARDVTYILKVRSSLLGGLFASRYMEIKTTAGAGACLAYSKSTTVSPNRLSGVVSSRNQPTLNETSDEFEGIALDNSLVQEPLESVDSGIKVDDSSILEAEERPVGPEPPVAPEATEGQPVDREQQTEAKQLSASAPHAAVTCNGYPVITPSFLSKTVNLAGIADFDLIASTTVANQSVSFRMVIYAQSVPPGLSVSYPASQTFPTNTSVPLKVRVYTTLSTPAGTYSLGLIMSSAGVDFQTIPVTVTLDAKAPVLEFVPDFQKTTVVVGSSVRFPITIVNRTTVSQSITYQMVIMESSTPAGVFASWPGPYTLNGGSTLTSAVVIYTTTATPQRTINFELRATAGNITSVEKLAVTVAPAAQPPTVSSINPSSPPVVNGNQNVGVNGNYFQPNLTVDVFNNGGSKIGTLSGSQIQNVAATSFTMVVNLGASAGSFGIEVVNPDGKRSGRFTFSTR